MKLMFLEDVFEGDDLIWIQGFFYDILDVMLDYYIVTNEKNERVGIEMELEGIKYIKIGSDD